MQAFRFMENRPRVLWIFCRTAGNFNFYKLQIQTFHLAYNLPELHKLWPHGMPDNCGHLINCQLNSALCCNVFLHKSNTIKKSSIRKKKTIQLKRMGGFGVPWICSEFYVLQCIFAQAKYNTCRNDFFFFVMNPVGGFY